MTTSFKAVLSISLAVSVFSLLSLIILKRTLETPTKKPVIKIDTSIKIAVLNGCGRKGLASMFAEKLRNDGFDVVNGLGGNADSFDYDTSIVIARKGKGVKKAEAVGAALGISEILIQRSGDPYLIEDVVVILGRDWNTLLTSKEESAD